MDSFSDDRLIFKNHVPSIRCKKIDFPKIVYFVSTIFLKHFLKVLFKNSFIKLIASKVQIIIIEQLIVFLRYTGRKLEKLLSIFMKVDI